MDLLRSKLIFVRLQKSEHEKESSPYLTGKNEHVGILGTKKQKVISSPFSSQSKDEASPVQTETGKGISNPLMVVNLNLRPNGGIQIPKPKDSSLVSSQMDDGIQRPKKNYYVVYNRPKPISEWRRNFG